MEKWQEFTDNKWVLSIVRHGFRIPSSKIPALSSVPIKMSQSSSPFIREEIENLLNKRALERVQNPGTPGFYSRIFLAPKRNGKLRLIIDLSLLNRYIEKLSVLVFFGPIGVAVASLGQGGGGGGGGCVGGWSWCFSCVCSVCACLDLSVSSSSWGLGRAAIRDCGTPLDFSLTFFFSKWRQSSR